jgi:hypothetical protein
MIVPDGCTGAEKLRQLLAAPEETHLDFRPSVDFKVTKDRVEFVMDAVTVANRPPAVTSWSASTPKMGTTGRRARCRGKVRRRSPHSRVAADANLSASTFAREGMARYLIA